MDKAEQWRKDGWNHDPVLLADIMSKYAEIHDGSGGLDMEMIDDVLMIAALDKDNAEEIESLRSELQKQKEINAELVEVGSQLINPGILFSEDLFDVALEKFKSLIKKSKES